MMRTGTIKFFDSEKGYGFIVPDNNSKDVFVHITILQKCNINMIKTGDRVIYDVGVDKTGRMSATDIDLI